ncbi:CheR family methyltransferase [Roseospirillum parvum]|uniref:protein-glutamate O-methyltransferase n=1 Tax=Roseospirillum parvum TaxID=83401 RepID=A0A1G8CM97_9PROT|nr:protein-glutamate O-methyltransferase [Roseospirillum parvum]SDH46484.1 chemotaxis protein methyltransferase CheR [Roseospirillum parvum]
MKPEDFDYLSKMLRDRSGLVLTKDKAYLLESRLMPVARKRGYKGLEDLVTQLRNRDETLANDVTEAMTTNESFFFRDVKPFDQFRQIVLPNLLKARATRKNFRIWCAAASSGQEPYTLAMILKEEAARLNGWRHDILGTDLSKEILSKAQRGIYSQFEVQRGLPIQMLVKYFKKADDMWEIDPAVRSMVQYKPWNLLQDLKPLGSFDVVFCRNVLIYFDQPTKTKVLNSIADLLADDGVLYLGGAETVLGISDRFKPIPGQRGVYAVQKPGYSGPSLGAAAG